MRRTSLFVLTLLLTVVHVSGEVKLEIGPDTTVIDGPLNPDGTINYLAYLNQKLSEGVTPENNFAVDLAMVMPESSWPDVAFKESMFEHLDIDHHPHNLPTFVRFANFLGIEGGDVTNTDEWRQASQAGKQSWKVSEFPEVKRWLDSNSAVLNYIEFNLCKTHFVMPYIADENAGGGLDSVPMPWLADVRGIARAFASRAQFRLRTGDIPGAWQDVILIHRLGDLVDNEPMLISWVVSVSIHRMVWQVIDDIASSDQLNKKYVGDMLSEIEAMDPLVPIFNVYGVQMRLSMLDNTSRCSNGLPGNPLISDGIKSMMMADQFSRELADRIINRWVDRYVQAGLHADYLTCVKELRVTENALEHNLKIALQLYGKKDQLATELLEKEITECGKYTVATVYRVIYILRAGPVNLYKYQANEQIRRDLSPLVLAIGGYHAEHGAYPVDLQALVPGYLEALPMDFATGELPVYRVADGVAIVYSLGTDLDDDGGVEGNNEDGDIVFRIDRR